MTFVILYVFGGIFSIWPMYRAASYMVKNDFPLSYASGDVSPIPYVIVAVPIWPIGILLAVLLLAEERGKQ